MMSTRTLGMIASVVTFVVVLFLGAILLFGLLVILNGFSGREGGAALLTAVVCQGAALIVAPLVAGRLARLLVEKHHWRRVLSIIASVLVGTVIFVGVGFVSVILGMAVAETMWRS